MTDLNDTERRLVKMLEAEAMQAVRDRLAAGLPGGTRTERINRIAYARGYSNAMAAVLNAIRTGQHKDERYDCD